MERSFPFAFRVTTKTRFAAVLSINLALTALTAQVVGPSVGKLENLFGMVGWAGRVPFYLLPLYVGPTILWIRPSIRAGVLLGLAAGVPLALWAVATRCAPPVPVVYLASGAIQGGLLSWIAGTGSNGDRFP